MKFTNYSKDGSNRRVPQTQLCDVDDTTCAIPPVQQEQVVVKVDGVDDYSKIIPTKAKEVKGIVIDTPQLNLRETPSKTGKILHVLNKDDEVLIVSDVSYLSDSEFVGCSFNKLSGFVNKKYIKF